MNPQLKPYAPLAGWALVASVLYLVLPETRVHLPLYGGDTLTFTAGGMIAFLFGVGLVVFGVWAMTRGAKKGFAAIVFGCAMPLFNPNYSPLLLVFSVPTFVLALYALSRFRAPSTAPAR